MAVGAGLAVTGAASVGTSPPLVTNGAKTQPAVVVDAHCCHIVPHISGGSLALTDNHLRVFSLLYNYFLPPLYGFCHIRCRGGYISEET